MEPLVFWPINRAGSRFRLAYRRAAAFRLNGDQRWGRTAKLAQMGLSVAH